MLATDVDDLTPSDAVVMKALLAKRNEIQPIDAELDQFNECHGNSLNFHTCRWKEHVSLKKQ